MYRKTFEAWTAQQFWDDGFALDIGPIMLIVSFIIIT